MSLKIADSILDKFLAENEIKKLQRKRKKGSHVYDSSKATMSDLSLPILVTSLFPLLHAPDLVCLALTSKDMAAKVMNVRPTVDDTMTLGIVTTTTKSRSVLTNVVTETVSQRTFIHHSSRRQLLLQLASYMRRGNRLCSVCLKYTRTSASKWHRASKNWFTHLYAADLYPKFYYCHHTCKSSHIEFFRHLVNDRSAKFIYHPTNTDPNALVAVELQQTINEVTDS